MGEELYKQYKLQYSVCSDVGKVREENQDYYAYSKTGKSQIFVVADGMGGKSGGQTAASIACHVIAHNAYSLDGKISKDSITEACEKANQVIFCLGERQPEFKGMGTTVVALGFNGEEYIIAAIGDSRVYRLHDKKFTQISKDNSLISELVEKGGISEENVKNSPISNIITKSLGPTYTIKEGFSVVVEKVVPGDTFLLCSDGLYNAVKDIKELENIIIQNPITTATQQLVDLANKNGGEDNITAMLVQVDEQFNEEVMHRLNWKVVETVFPEHGLKLNLDFEKVDSVLQKLVAANADMPPIITDAELTENKAKTQNSQLIGDNKLERLKFPAPKTEANKKATFIMKDEDKADVAKPAPHHTFVFGDPAEVEEEPVEQIEEITAEVRGLFDSSGKMYTTKMHRIISIIFPVIVLMLIVTPIGIMLVNQYKKDQIVAEEKRIEQQILMKIDTEKDNKVIDGLRENLQNEFVSFADSDISTLKIAMDGRVSNVIPPTEKVHSKLSDSIRFLRGDIERLALSSISKKTKDLTLSEKRTVREQKIRLRLEIMNTDKSLEALNLISRKAIEDKITSLITEQSWVNGFSNESRLMIDKNKSDVNTLIEYHNILEGQGEIKSIDKDIDWKNPLMQDSKILKKAIDDYMQARENYSQALAIWKNDFRNPKKQTEMTVAGIKFNHSNRILKALALEYINVLIKAKRNKIVELALLNVKAGIYTEHLETVIKFLKNFEPIASRRLHDEKEAELLSTRMLAEAKYKLYDAKLSDEEEQRLNEMEANAEAQKM